MDIYSQYKAINDSTINLLSATNKLTSPILEQEQNFIRLKENPFVLTEDIKQTCRSVVTSHDIQQYRNQFHSIKLEDDVDSWLLELLKIDEGEGF